MQTRPPKCSFSQPTREKPYLQYLVTQQSNIIPHLVDSPNFQTYKYTKGDISTFYHSDQSTDTTFYGTFLHSTILQTQSDQSTDTTFYVRGHFYILPLYKIKVTSLQTQHSTLVDNSTFLPPKSTNSKVISRQIYYPPKQHSYIPTIPTATNLLSFQTKVEIPTFLPFKLQIPK